MKRLTPVLCVEEIEPVLPFWVDRLGFEVTAEVPHGDRLGFVVLKNGGVEVMYQTHASLAVDAPPLAKAPVGNAFLFIEVHDLEPVAKALRGIDLVVPRRQTFYGADELIVRDPVGNAITFAHFGTRG